MPAAPPPHRLSSGVVVVSLPKRQLRFLLLRAYRNWDFPKGMVEAGEEPIDAALREVREETTLDDLSFDWGLSFMETGPYNKGKISRYYIARSKEMQVLLPVNPELGMPEHHEARWFAFDEALAKVSPRLQPVVRWAHAIINREPIPSHSAQAPRDASAQAPPPAPRDTSAQAPPPASGQTPATASGQAPMKAPTKASG
jgi:8-oxo-dGTP pyrophosphatase MutT (NUDIX family)